uniref:Plastocyanin-like domain-containing protein n=1 Tax=Panagrolaimus superbus TaxID=310955 RepID=A0A914Z8P3_9BILA
MQYLDYLFFVGENIRIRIINGASSHMMMLTIDEHKYTVVSADGYPIKSIETDLMIINPGERYDIIIQGLVNPQRQSYPIIIETMEHFNKSGSKIEPFFGAAKLFYEDFNENSVGDLLNPDWYHFRRCKSERRCLVLNCPFKQFPKEYNFNCKYAIDFESLNPLKEEDSEILSNNGFESGYEEYFINMHYDSHMNGWMYQMPRGIPYFHKQNLQEFAKPCNRKACPAESDARFDDSCFCFYHLNITLGNIVQLVIYNMGYGGGYTNGYAHPFHIHGTHYYLLKMAFPEYNETNFVKQPNQDIDCEQTQVKKICFIKNV